MTIYVLQTERNGCFSTKVLVASFNLTSLHYENQLYAYASLLEEGTGERSHADSHLVMSWGGGTWHNCSARVSPGSLPFPSISISRSVA